MDNRGWGGLYLYTGDGDRAGWLGLVGDNDTGRYQHGQRRRTMACLLVVLYGFIVMLGAVANGRERRAL